MQLVLREDAVALRDYAKEIGSDLAVDTSHTICKVFLPPPPHPAEA